MTISHVSAITWNEIKPISQLRSRKRLRKRDKQEDECESAWPPSFPAGPIRDDDAIDHLSEEELKQQLCADISLLPPPELGNFVRAHRLKKRRQGCFPHKTFYLTKRIERRDSFNSVISSTQDNEDVKTSMMNSTHSNPKGDPDCKLESQPHQEMLSKEMQGMPVTGDILLTRENIERAIKVLNGELCEEVIVSEDQENTQSPSPPDILTEKPHDRGGCCSCIMV